MRNRNSTSTVTFPGPVVFGTGCIAGIAEQVRSLGGTRPFVVTGRRLHDAGVAERVLAPLRCARMDVVLHHAGGLDPTDLDVSQAVQHYRASGADVIVALGGGSRIDLAKAARFLAARNGHLGDYYLQNAGPQPIVPGMVPLIAVPTTAGSGSEVSRGAVIIDTEVQRKKLIAGPGLMASVSMLDPELTCSMQPSLTASTGLDALSHAIETAAATGDNPFAEATAQRAAELIWRHLFRAFTNGLDIEARRGMQFASTMAAMGFSKGLGVVHSLAHQLTPALGVSHGVAVALILPRGMRFNIDTAAAAYARLARGLGLSAEHSDREAATALVDGVERLISDLGLPRRLVDIGVQQVDVARLAQAAMLDHCHATNPRPCDTHDMESLLDQVA